MVKALHAADIEVILDVVYNHTAEGNHLGPTLSFRGIDNANYYRLVDDDPAHYFDTTGTGNSLLMRSPHVLQLIMDSLRYWVTEMHVDGFRFDLAATLARQFHEVDRLSAFFDLVHQDPVVSQVKLIAEPWDVGDGGYQVGGFPPLWSEWNGKYRDTVRDFWRGEPSDARRVRQPAVGLADLYEHSGRRPHRQRQLRHRARRLHAERPRLLQREAQRGQRRGQPRRREPQPVLELRRRGSDRRPRDPRAPRTPAAQLPDDPAALAGRPDDLARRRAGAHAARQQQRVLPGQPDLVGRLGPGRGRRPSCSSSRAASSGCGRTTRCSGAAASSRASPTWGRLRPARHRLAHAGRPPHARRRVGRRPRARRHGVPQRRRDPGARHARAGDRRRQLPAAVQRPAGRRDVHGPGPSVTGTWTAVLDTDSRIESGSTVEAGTSLLLREQSIIVFTRPPIAPSPTSSGTGAVGDGGQRGGQADEGPRADGGVGRDAEAPHHPTAARRMSEPRPTPTRRLPSPGKAVPVSTYRVQLGADLTLDDVAARVPYLASLGVTHVYLSPVLRAAPGSTHGYDVVDHDEVSPDARRAAGAAPARDRRARHGPRPRARHRAQPHGGPHAGVAQPGAVVGTARGPGVAVRRLVRRRLVRGRRRRAHAGARRPHRGRPRPRRAAARGGRVPGEGPRTSCATTTTCSRCRPGTEALPLAELVERQHYRLAYWRVADEELNYRRFFDVGTLLAVRVEDPAVFDATHALVLSLLADGTIDGLRIDHPDGLADPARLPARGCARRPAAPGWWSRRSSRATRRCRADWETAGHHRLRRAVAHPGDVRRPRAERASSVPSCTGSPATPPTRSRPIVEHAKREIVDGPLYAEVHRLTSLAADICRDDLRLRDHTWRALRGLPDRAARRVRPLPRLRRARRDRAPGLARGHVRRGRAGPGPPVAGAQRDHGRRRATSCSAVRSAAPDATRGPRRDELVVRFQQTCGAVMAKGVEDTAFYRWTHLTSLCEVGGRPGAVRAHAHRPVRLGRRRRRSPRRSA